MAEKEFTAKISPDVDSPFAGQSVTVKYDFGDSLADLTALCSTGKTPEEGEKIVFSNAVQNLTVSLQSKIRAGIKAGKSSEEIQESVSAWVPGFVQRGKSAAEKATDAIAKVDSAEDLAAMEEFLAQRKAELAANG